VGYSETGQITANNYSKVLLQCNFAFEEHGVVDAGQQTPETCLGIQK